MVILAFVGMASADHMANESIEARVKPSGSVYRVGGEIPVSKPIQMTTTGTRDAKKIYDTYCTACHATDAIGAPMFGNAASWKDRIGKGEDVLVANAIKGINAMPANVTCIDCSETEIAETVKYMLENSQ